MLSETLVKRCPKLSEFASFAHRARLKNYKKIIDFRFSVGNHRGSMGLYFSQEFWTLPNVLKNVYKLEI